MRKDMNPLVSVSPFGGTLVEEQVAGATSGNLNPENNVETGRGRDRSMFVYVPKSGCPHPKQTKVLMVLRDVATASSAQELLDGLGIAALAEEGHFVVVFPNPLEEGWNYALDAECEDDAAFIVRCFAELGFVAHVRDTSLGLADGLPRTWYEYVPARLRNATDPVPLVFYLHGINCCGLYGAEQSGWIKIAEREGLAVVFPVATIEDRWNGWDDPRLPSDMDFIMALIEHMAQVVPVDRRRIYASGFSMGSMMTNALASAHPDVFAGAIALNGPHQSYLTTLDQSAPMLLAFKRTSVLRDLEPSGQDASPLRAVADGKKDAFAYRMPVVQFVGLADGMGLPSGRAWPLTEADESLWKGTLSYWLAYDNCGELGFDAAAPSGFASDTLERVGERFNVQGWRSADDGAPELYRFVTVDRLEHAVDPRALELGWQYVRGYAREADGSLTYTK